MSQSQAPNQPVNTPQKPATPSYSVNVNNLGIFLDGWADLIEGMGDKAAQVRQDVLNQLQEREMPEIKLGYIAGYVGLVNHESRDYVVAETNPGASTMIYISQHGKDLFVSWRTWLKPVFNWEFLQWFVLGSVLLGLFIGGIRQSNSYWGPSETTFSFFGWIFATFVLLLLSAMGLTTAGKFLKGNLMAFIYVEANMFDAEDITAMSFSVHKTILRALDQSGIDVSKLRLKQTFKGGRKGDEV